MALRLDDAAHAILASLVARLRSSQGRLAWVRPEGIHLTLRFLGQTPEKTLEALLPLLMGAARACPPLEAELEGVSFLPTPRRPRLLCVRVGLPETGFALQSACEGAARALGFEAVTRPFRPHLTLARFRDGGRGFPLPEGRLGRTRLSELVLFESRLGPGGSVYTPIRSFSLGAQ